MVTSPRYCVFFICLNVLFSFSVPSRSSDWGDTIVHTPDRTTRQPPSQEDVPLRVVVFIGSVREGRKAGRVSQFIQRKLTETGHEVDLIGGIPLISWGQQPMGFGLREQAKRLLTGAPWIEVWCASRSIKVEERFSDPEIIDLPLLRRPLHYYENRGQAPSILRQFNGRVKSADAYVVLTTEYNRQLPPALTNLLDHLPPLSYAFKISGIISYTTAPAGGLMAAAQARNLMTELGAPPIPLILHIPQVDKHLDENGNVLWNEEYLNKQTAKFITQLDWFATALRRHSDNVGRPAWNSSMVSV